MRSASGTSARNRSAPRSAALGPAYLDKFARVGIRVQDLYDPKIFRDKLEAVVKETNKVLVKIYNQLAFDPGEIADAVPRLRRDPRPICRRHGTLRVAGDPRWQERDL